MIERYSLIDKNGEKLTFFADNVQLEYKPIQLIPTVIENL